MNPLRFRDSVNTFCDQYGGQVVEHGAETHLAYVHEGRVVVDDHVGPFVIVEYATVPEEGPAQLEAGRLGLRLGRSENRDHLTPA